LARKATGTLIWTGRQWSARFGSGPMIPLGVADKRIANARLRALARDGYTPTASVETLAEAVRRIVGELEADGMVTADERLSRLERYVLPDLGGLLVTAIKPGQVTAVLEGVARAGLSRQTVVHVRNDLSKIFGELIRDEVLTRNPAKAEFVKTPKVAKDKRRRALLTDHEFASLVSAPTTRPQLRVMAICSRAFGGMRTSDLHEWRWSDVDTTGWAYADVPRPKTEHLAETGGDEPAPRERIALPEDVAATLRSWWYVAGADPSGLVFPVQTHSYARELRSALRRAGVVRVELHKPTPTTKPVDFHSFRRAFVTAVGAAGLNAQTAMRLTGHTTMATHMRYNQPAVLEIPSGAVPNFRSRPAADNRSDGHVTQEQDG
jgi:integrase